MEPPPANPSVPHLKWAPGTKPDDVSPRLLKHRVPSTIFAGSDAHADPILLETTHRRANHRGSDHRPLKKSSSNDGSSSLEDLDVEIRNTAKRDKRKSVSGALDSSDSTIASSDEDSFSGSASKSSSGVHLDHESNAASCCFSNSVIFVNIAVHLEFPDILSAIKVCRLWRQFGDSRDMWLPIYNAYVSKIKAPEEADINIWSDNRPDEDKEVNEDKEGNIRFATLNGLVERLTPPTGIPDKMDGETLLNTYLTFTTTQQLVRKLFERYNVPTPTNVVDYDKWSKESKRPIQVRTCYILKALVQKSWTSFDRELKHLMCVMIRLIDKNLALVLKIQISKEEAKSRPLPPDSVSSSARQSGSGFSLSLPVSAREAHSSVGSSHSSPGSAPPLTARRLGNTLMHMFGRHDLEAFSSHDIAKQLTMLDFAVYAKIQPQELVNQSWSKKNKDVLSPNVRRIIERFNQITRAIATSILSQEKIKSRCKIYVKWIKIADSLRKLNNFHTLMAVLMGLEEGSVYRLKFTKEEIDPKHLKTLEDLRAIMSSDSSYSTYRKALAAAKPPCLPYLGIYLRDLVYIETGTVAEQDAADQKHIIQFRQKKKVFGVIHFLQSYQTTAYNFTTQEDIVEYLENMQVLEEDKMFELSQKREPKGAKRSSIL